MFPHAWFDEAGRAFARMRSNLRGASVVWALLAILAMVNAVIFLGSRVDPANTEIELVVDTISTSTLVSPSTRSSTRSALDADTSGFDPAGPTLTTGALELAEGSEATQSGAAVTTVGATTPATTSAPTSAGLTTVVPTTGVSTTVRPPTTAVSTTAGSTTAVSTTVRPPTTAVSTTAAPTTVRPPTTAVSTTAAPTTAAPTTTARPTTTAASTSTTLDWLERFCQLVPRSPLCRR